MASIRTLIKFQIFREVCHRKRQQTGTKVCRKFLRCADRHWSSFSSGVRPSGAAHGLAPASVESPAILVKPQSDIACYPMGITFTRQFPRAVEARGGTSGGSEVPDWLSRASTRHAVVLRYRVCPPTPGMSRHSSESRLSIRALGQDRDPLPQEHTSTAPGLPVAVTGP